jgi:molybdate transport system substrate-binding protein
MIRGHRLSTLLLSCLLLSCGREGDDELLLFAAASLTESMTQLVARFEETHPHRVTVNLAGSHTLATQILEGGPADLFASADKIQMDRVIEEGRCEKAVPFATNALLLLLPAENPAAVERWEDLGKAGVRLVLAEPHVPAGAYSRLLIRRLGLEEGVAGNVVSLEQTVKGVVGKVVLGEADAGVVFVTDRTPSVAKETIAIPPPDSVSVRAEYFVGVLEGAPNRPAADAFVSFLLSSEGRKILKRFGFGDV